MEIVKIRPEMLVVFAVKIERDKKLPGKLDLTSLVTNKKRFDTRKCVINARNLLDDAGLSSL
jgi:hypothetical protein